MATTIKEPAPFPSKGSPTAAPAAAGQQAASRADAIGAEIPVVVHASRHSAAAPGTGKPLPPLHEETHTAIVFPQGCVVRLSASLFAGELVVITNQRTGADVLCRVTGVKTHPGIQNYVDLQFTQRAPGFWGPCFPTEFPAQAEGLAPGPALPAAAVALPVAAPVHRPAPLPSLQSEPVSQVRAATPVPELAPPAIPVAVPAVQPSRPSPVPVVAPPSPKNTLETAASPQPLQSFQPGFSAAAGSEQVWVKKSSPILGKALWAAAGALVVVGLSAGSFLLGRHGQSASPAVTSVAATSASAPVRPQAVATTHTDQPVSLASVPTATTAANTALSETSLEEPSIPGRRDEKLVSAPQPEARRPVIRTEKLEGPIAKTPARAASSEAPPVLQAQGNGGAENIFGASFVASSARTDLPAPPPPVAPANSPARSIPQLEVARLISSRPPVYPPQARQMRVGGVVVVDALVDATGKVASATIVSGPIVLQQAALDAARACLYQPARLNGQPVASHTNVNIDFALQ